MTQQNTALSYTTDIAPTPGDALLQTNINILRQLTAALATLPDTIYTHQPDPQTSSIGMHTRHIIEFYQEFLNCANNTIQTLCYDNRQRDMQLETIKDSALTAIQTIKATLNKTEPADKDINLPVTINPNAPMLTIRSTIMRELYHLIDHTTHHMAIIKMIAQTHAITFDKTFGLASATISSQENKNA